MMDICESCGVLHDCDGAPADARGLCYDCYYEAAPREPSIQKRQEPPIYE